VDVNVSMNLESKRKFKSAMDEFLHRSGKSTEESIDVMAMSAGKQLASKMQPYGLNQKQGEKFKRNIGRQVEQVWFGVNLGEYPATGDIRAAHRDQRMAGKNKGTVEFRKFQKKRGQRWLDLISVGDKENHKRRMQARAGQAKGAWIAAANSIGKSRLTGLPAWVSRHDNSSYGKSQKTGEGLKRKASMENTIFYIKYRIQPSSQVKSAMRLGLKNGTKHLQHLINGEIKKANRLLS
jgi:hypothetical protein